MQVEEFLNQAFNNFRADGTFSQDESTPIVSPVGDTDEDSKDGKLT
jgi:hypothetical protein